MEMTSTQPLRRFEASQGPRLLGRDAGTIEDFGSFAVRFMAWREETGGGFSLIEHPIPPRSLCAEHGLDFPLGS